jgi:hypothetical protein
MTREIHNNRGARAGSGDTSTVPLKAMHVFVTAVERKHTLHFAHLLHTSRIRHHDSQPVGCMDGVHHTHLVDIGLGLLEDLLCGHQDHFGIRVVDNVLPVFFGLKQWVVMSTLCGMVCGTLPEPRT